KKAAANLSPPTGEDLQLIRDRRRGAYDLRRDRTIPKRPKYARDWHSGGQTRQQRAPGNCKKQKVAGACSGDLCPIWLPTLDNLRNLFLTPTSEMLSFFQQVQGTF
ncbi:MAG: hypothetical protein WAM70_04280, partial [Pyrinomonadaceae bacterium]